MTTEEKLQYLSNRNLSFEIQYLNGREQKWQGSAQVRRLEKGETMFTWKTEGQNNPVPNYVFESGVTLDELLDNLINKLDDVLQPA